MSLSHQKRNRWRFVATSSSTVQNDLLIVFLPFILYYIQLIALVLLFSVCVYLEVEVENLTTHNCITFLFNVFRFHVRSCTAVCKTSNFLVTPQNMHKQRAQTHDFCCCYIFICLFCVVFKKEIDYQCC